MEHPFVHFQQSFISQYKPILGLCFSDCGVILPPSGQKISKCSFKIALHVKKVLYMHVHTDI